MFATIKLLGLPKWMVNAENKISNMFVHLCVRIIYKHCKQIEYETHLRIHTYALLNLHIIELLFYGNVVRWITLTAAWRCACFVCARNPHQSESIIMYYNKGTGNSKSFNDAITCDFSAAIGLFFTRVLKCIFYLRRKLIYNCYRQFLPFVS